MNQNKQECYALNGPVLCVCVHACVREREIDSDGDYVVSVISAFCILTYLNMHTKKPSCLPLCQLMHIF